MRNFSTVIKNAFQSYNINCGEYVSDVRVTEVLSALARALETEPRLVTAAYQQLLDKGESSIICGSEVSVLCDLLAFQAAIRSSESQPSTLAGSTYTFTYCNLNTGVCVQWIHLVA